MPDLYLHYGCGLAAPAGRLNLDASPTLRLQRLPGVGRLLRTRLNAQFPAGVRYGDIMKGLPGVTPKSARAVYCSHVLEHLSLVDCRLALQRTYQMLQPGGVFRCVVPDLEEAARHYVTTLNADLAERQQASHRFLQTIILGQVERPRGIKALAELVLGNAEHRWMWDRHSLQHELKNAGFGSIRACFPGDADDPMFQRVENPARFRDAVALEAIK